MKAGRPNILILTTHTGGGHQNLAQALKSMLEIDYEVAIVNPQHALVDHYYAFVSRHGLKFLEWQYTCTDSEIASLWLHHLLTSLSFRRLLSILEQIQPQLIITTHAMLSYATARANEHRRKRIPLVFQLTDLGRLHSTWFTEKQADAYLAPTREIFAQAREQGIDKHRLHLTGRPVRRQFLETAQASASGTRTSVGNQILVSALHAALDLNPAVFTLFLQGGAKGSAAVNSTIEHLLSAGLPIQIILAVGNNKGMAARYTGRKEVRTISFTENIAPYMAAADVIAGKAGASFITEAFMLEKPFLATTYIPGQETPNLHFLEQHNLGWVCLESSAQKGLLMRLASKPALLAEKLASIRAYKAWNIQANTHIRPIIAQLLSSRER